MAPSIGNDLWDLHRIRQIVSENDLERGCIEYKRQLDNGGRKALEAITALANTFGGVVLIGVDEDKQGVDRLTGVDASSRDKLVSYCWNQLTPPFSPEIVPISLGSDDLYILVVIIDTDYIRRPVMINQGNKVLVRLEGQNQSPDWYRLRDLFTEQPPSYQDMRLPPADPTGLYSDASLGLRGRLLLIGPRSRSSRISDAAREQTLDALRNDSPITGAGSGLTGLMHDMIGRSFDVDEWHLTGQANGREFSAYWHGLVGDSIASVRARIDVDINPRPAHGDTLLVTLTALITRPLPNGITPRQLTENPLGPFLSIGVLHKLMLDITSTLWGVTGEAISTSILGQPLGPPALLDSTVFTTPLSKGTDVPSLNECIAFGTARLISGNTPGTWTTFSPERVERSQVASRSGQEPIIRNWLIQLGIENGYQNITKEVSRWSEITT
jgi:hypothetical protein